MLGWDVTHASHRLLCLMALTAIVTSRWWMSAVSVRPSTDAPAGIHAIAGFCAATIYAQTDRSAR